MKQNKALKIILKAVLIIAIIYFFVLPFLNWFIGYHGYEKEKMRRNSWGNIEESKYRNAFVDKLDFQSNIEIDSFQVFIEKGYKWGYFSSSKTSFNLEDSKFPYQISHIERADNNDVVYAFSDNQKFDSIDEHQTVFLKKPILKDTLIMSITKLSLIKINGTNKLLQDSIGYIKVYQKK